MLFNCGAEEKVEPSIRYKVHDEDNPHVKGIPILECDYDSNPNSLYVALEDRDWNAVSDILGMTGEGDDDDDDDDDDDGSIAEAGNDNSKAEENETTRKRKILAMTWVLRRNTDGTVKWRITPLHASVLFDAPENVLERLLVVHPVAVQLKDDQGNLPLHLAYKTGLSDDKLDMLIAMYPESTEVLNHRGKLARNCVKVNGTVVRMKKEHDTQLTRLGAAHESEVGRMTRQIQELNREKKSVTGKAEEEMEEMKRRYEEEMNRVKREAEDEVSRVKAEAERLMAEKALLEKMEAEAEAEAELQRKHETEEREGIERQQVEDSEPSQHHNPPYRSKKQPRRMMAIAKTTSLLKKIGMPCPTKPPSIFTTHAKSHANGGGGSAMAEQKISKE